MMRSHCPVREMQRMSPAKYRTAVNDITRPLVDAQRSLSRAYDELQKQQMGGGLDEQATGVVTSAVLTAKAWVAKLEGFLR